MKSVASPSKRTALLAALAGWSASWVWAGAAPETPPGPVASLRGERALIATAAAAPERKVVELEARIPRTFDQQPPLVPHATEKQVINLTRNRGVECHDRPSYEKAELPKISDSHYVDRAGKELDHVASPRYFCTQCHVTQVDARRSWRTPSRDC